MHALDRIAVGLGRCLSTKNVARADFFRSFTPLITLIFPTRPKSYHIFQHAGPIRDSAHEDCTEREKGVCPVMVSDVVGTESHHQCEHARPVQLLSESTWSNKCVRILEEKKKQVHTTYTRRAGLDWVPTNRASRWWGRLLAPFRCAPLTRCGAGNQRRAGGRVGPARHGARDPIQA